MKKQHGFTLVELLIVIIIIGILATMAVPQYQKMVEKAKFPQAYIKMDALRKTENVYYMQFNNWLDIDSPATDPQYVNKISSLLLEPTDYTADKYFRYWWGTGSFTTTDGITHTSGVAFSERLDAESNLTNKGLWLFNDDGSIWYGTRNPQKFEEKLR